MEVRRIFGSESSAESAPEHARNAEVVTGLKQVLMVSITAFNGSQMGWPVVGSATVVQSRPLISQLTESGVVVGSGPPVLAHAVDGNVDSNATESSVQLLLNVASGVQ
jgi:hypothetical protein